MYGMHQQYQQQQQYGGSSSSLPILQHHQQQQQQQQVLLNNNSNALNNISSSISAFNNNSSSNNNNITSRASSSSNNSLAHLHSLFLKTAAVVAAADSGSGVVRCRSGAEPTSVLDLRSPSPNNSRALSASSSSNTNTTPRKPAAVSSSSASSDCNNTFDNTVEEAKVKSATTRGLHFQQQQQQQQRQQQQQISSSFVQSSSSELQDELEQAVAAAGGYGGGGSPSSSLPLFYSAQGIRQIENFGGAGGSYDEQHQQQNDPNAAAGTTTTDQWLLQDVVGSQQHDHHHSSQILEGNVVLEDHDDGEDAGDDDHDQHQQQHKQKLEELESELLSSCPSPPPLAPQGVSSSAAPQDTAPFISWWLQETSTPSASSTGEVDVLLPPPPWQQQHHQQQQQQQHQHQNQMMMMMMVKQEQQQQQQHQPSSSTSSLPPHLAHLESFTRRTLPLVSSAPPPLFQHHFQEQPQSQQQQPTFNMNLLWQQQHQQPHQQQNLHMGLQPQHSFQHRDPFLMGMIQDEQHHQMFGAAQQSPTFLQTLGAPQRPHAGFFMENLSPLSPGPLHLLQQQQQQLRDLQSGVKQQQRPLSRNFLDEHHQNQMLLRPGMNPMQSLKREHVQMQHLELQQPSSKLARLSSANAQPGHVLQRGATGTGTGIGDDLSFVSRLLLQAAEACESGQEELAQSILARLNDHQHHHQQIFLQQNQQQQQQQQHQKQQQHKLQLPPAAHRVGILFKEILADKVCKREALPPPPPSTAAEIVEQVEAFKSFCEASNVLKFSHLVANQAIAEAIESEDCVHILDISESARSSSYSSFGGQWSIFVASMLQQKHPRPMKIRLTLTSTRQHALHFAIESLKDFAREYPNSAVEFEFRGVLTQPGAPLNLSDLGVQSHEVLVVNLVLGLHKLVPVSEVLETVRAANPKLLLLVERELEPRSIFSARFKDGLEYYTALAESLSPEDYCMSVEEVDKVEQLVWKPEIRDLLHGHLAYQKLHNWRVAMTQAGLHCSKLSDMCEKLAVSLFNLDRSNNSSSSTNNRGFELVKDDGSLLLGFRGKILASASAWSCC